MFSFTRYFRKILEIFSSPPFYTTYVRLPTIQDPTPPEIRNNPKFWPFLKGALGAIDGSHIHLAPPAIDRPSYRNRKGFCSQNCLFGCSFSLQFIYALTGWEGSATDARMISRFLLASTISQTLGTHFVTNSLYHIGECITILPNGVAQI
jgi:hypothetical protein